MNRGILLAWLFGMGLITWRGVKKVHKPVSPGQYMAASGVYAMLALLAEIRSAELVAVLLAWGFDLAVVFQVLPGQVAGPSSSSSEPAPKQATATPQPHGA